jgi:ankyrin repeat protein
MARQSEVESITACCGAQKFRAPEASQNFYNRKCDVWSFGILVGDLCENPQDTPKFLVEQSEREDALMRDLVGSVQLPITKGWKETSLSNIKARVGQGGGDSGTSLWELANKCLGVAPQSRPEFKFVLENYLEDVPRSGLDDRFVKYIESKMAERISNKIEDKVARRIRQVYKKMKITSFEWIQGEDSTESSQVMANTAIDFAFVDLVLETGGFTKSLKEKVTLDELWKSHRNRIVAQGRAGSGKSTLLKWIAYQWAIGSLWQDFDVVIHANLRELTKFKTLEKMVMYALSLSSADKKMVTELLESKAKILWLLDGWDEISKHVPGVLKKIQENNEPRVQWMIAGTRPEAAMQIACDIKLDVVGFSKEGQHLYISRYFSKNPELAEKLPKLLDTNKYMKEVCSLPLMLNLVCFSLPKIKLGENLKFVEIYRKSLDQLIDRTVHSSSFACTKKDLERCLENLAFQHQNHISVKTADLENHLALKVGVLHAKNGTIRWNHISFAEYFCAKYCVSEKLNYFESVPKNSNDLGQVFYSCLSKNTDYREFLQEQLKIENRNGFLQICCLECGEPFWNQLLAEAKDWRVRWPIWEACLRSEPRLCRMFYEESPSFCIEQGFPMVGISSDESFVSFLISKGADPNKAMKWATGEGNVSMIRFLISEGANPNEGLRTAVVNENIPLVELFIETGADPDNGIYAAACNGNEFLVKFLLEKRANPDIGIKGALVLKNERIIRFLVMQGGNPSIAICDAALEGNKSLVEFLLENGADPNIGVKGAIQKNNEPLIEFLLSEGADLDTAIFWAASSENDTLIKKFLELGAAPNKALQGIAAAKNPNKSLIKFLLDRGADPTEGIEGATSAGYSDESIVVLLADAKADRNIGLYWAARNGNKSLVEFWLGRGADPNTGIRGALEWLNEAEGKRSGEKQRRSRLCKPILELLVENGANDGLDGATAWANATGDDSIIKLLVEDPSKETEDPSIDTENLQDYQVNPQSDHRRHCLIS